MRVMVFFDLPIDTSEERRAYRHFRKGLITKGFIMMQESVYTKIALTPAAARSIIKYVKTIRPRHGLIQALVITEKQYSEMELILGQMQSEIIDSEERLVIL